MQLTFSSFPLAAPIQQAITEEGYTVPTPIQAKAIPPVLEGHDVLGVAQTGTGKTAAFALPMIHRLMTAEKDKSSRGPKMPRALILSPTRELATQIADSFNTYGRHAALDTTVIYGGVSQYHQVRALHRGVDIIVATPGRLMDLMQQRVVNLNEVEIFVLDEADRMLDMGFIQPIRFIAAALKNKKQTLLFSATMPSEIKHLADSLLKNPVRVSVASTSAAAETVEQSVYMVNRDRKLPLLQHLIRSANIQRVVVFTRTKHGADKVARRLNNVGLSALAIHGNKAQNLRTRTLESFKSGRTRVLVATDVAARGLDVDGISHVINFDIPMEPESYIHRVGRTGRAGASGIAVSFCDSDERSLLRQVERLLRKPIPLAKMDAELAEKLATEEKVPGAELPHASSEDGQSDRGDYGRGGRRPRQGSRFGDDGHAHRPGGTFSGRRDQSNASQPRTTGERSARPRPVEGWNVNRAESRSASGPPSRNPDVANGGDAPSRTPREGATSDRREGVNSSSRRSTAESSGTAPVRDLANMQPFPDGSNATIRRAGAAGAGAGAKRTATQIGGRGAGPKPTSRPTSAGARPESRGGESAGSFPFRNKQVAESGMVAFNQNRGPAKRGAKPQSGESSGGAAAKPGAKRRPARDGEYW